MAAAAPCELGLLTPYALKFLLRFAPLLLGVPHVVEPLMWETIRPSGCSRSTGMRTLCVVLRSSRWSVAMPRLLAGRCGGEEAAMSFGIRRRPMGILKLIRRTTIIMDRVRTLYSGLERRPFRVLLTTGRPSCILAERRHAVLPNLLIRRPCRYATARPCKPPRSSPRPTMALDLARALRLTVFRALEAPLGVMPCRLLGIARDCARAGLVAATLALPRHCG